MMTSRMDFEVTMRAVDSLIDRTAGLPEQVFRGAVAAFYVIDFDRFWSDAFFQDVQQLTAAVGDEAFTLAVLDPNPVEYFHAHFAKFPVLRFSAGDSVDAYISAINEDPGDSPADAIAYNSRIVVIFPPSKALVLYGDRDFEIAIIAVMDDRAVKVLESMPSLGLFTMREALEQLLRSAPGAALLQNYATFTK